MYFPITRLDSFSISLVTALGSLGLLHSRDAVRDMTHGVVFVYIHII